MDAAENLPLIIEHNFNNIVNDIMEFIDRAEMEHLLAVNMKLTSLPKLLQCLTSFHLYATMSPKCP